MRQNINFGKLLHGGDYNPEQWLEYPEILEQDLAYFKKAKINAVKTCSSIFGRPYLFYFWLSKSIFIFTYAASFSSSG